MLALLLALWVIAALVIGATGGLATAGLPPPAFALLTTIVLVGLVWLLPPLRVCIQKLGIAPLVAIHLTRAIIGVYFLLLAREGVLPGAFAYAAGWGDLVVGVAALAVLMFAVPARTDRQRLFLLGWNTAGLLDILLVLANGLRLFARTPEIAAPFTQLPLALLPLLVVPLVISTHLWIFAWSAPPVEPLPADPLVRPPE